MLRRQRLFEIFDPSTFRTDVTHLELRLRYFTHIGVQLLWRKIRLHYKIHMALSNRGRV